MLPAALALLGALVYGGADFLGGLAARRLRSIVVTSVAAAAGLVALIVAVPLLGGAWSAADAGWGALAGFFGVLAVILLYACLAIGPMSILSPLTAVVSAIAPMLWGLLVNGETLGAVGWAGLGVALVAVVLVSFVPGAKTVRPSTRGVVMAIGSGVCIGAFLIVMDRTSEASGLVPLLISRAFSVVATGTVVLGMLAVAVHRGRPVVSALVVQGAPVGATPFGRADLEHAHERSPLPTQPLVPLSAWVIAAACGIVDAAANALMLVALRLGDLAVVSALTALYPAGTILLAAVVLRERIAVVQWIGLGLAVLAGGMLAAA